MTATPVQSDLTLWHALRTRRRRNESRRGLDATAHRWLSRLKHRKIGLAELRRRAETAVAMEAQWMDLSDRLLDERMGEIREVFARRQHTTQHVCAGMAAIREVARRETGELPYMVQLMGALGLFYGQIVEMVTGEGKTLTASVAATMLGWLRKPVHVITVNDYLAERDVQGRQPIFRRCGLMGAAVLGETQGTDRLQAYRHPIVYTTQKELVADWLRDQLRLGRVADPVSTRWRLHESGPSSRPVSPSLANPADVIMVPGLHVAIVDEADAVLIDEAVTPLIIAQARGEDAQANLYERARDLAEQLTIGEHYKIDLAKRRARLTSNGRTKIDSLISESEHGIWRAKRRREELVQQALVAQHCYLHGQHYQIVEERVVIVDEFTGRFMHDRKWQHGLHQAVEAKHKLKVTADQDTLASMSFQRFFGQYPHLCGMTGTAADATAELETTYGVPVRVIPTNRPLQRQRLKDLIFATTQLKWEAIVDEIEQMHQQGRPVLVGTRSIEASDYLSRMLSDRGLEHQVLNAVHHASEAQIVAGAGQPGAITVATNMAGRGTDIKLGRGVDDAGGLHVILTERHAAYRIDRQLFGRAGRQGDPGSARVILSLEDELPLKFARSATKTLQRYYGNRTKPLPQRVRFVFDLAQRRAQRQAFASRYSVMRHDEDLDRTLPR